MPISGGTMYGRTAPEWEQLKEAGRDFLKDRTAERRGDAAHDTTVAYGDANEQLAARTGQPAFDFGQQAGHVAMGYLLGRISRNRNWPAAGLLISVLVRYPGEADVGPGIFNLAQEVGQQPFLDDYRDALKFRIALHLAELACEYAPPSQGEEAHAAQRHQT